MSDLHDADLAALRAERDTLRAYVAGLEPHGPPGPPVPPAQQRQWAAKVRARARQQRDEAQAQRRREGAG